MRILLLVALLVLVAGCTTPPVTSPAPVLALSDARVFASPVAPPTAVAALSFLSDAPVATGFLGEPTLVADQTGVLYLTFPGYPDNKDSCNNGPVYRSPDGLTWSYLNHANGSLDASGKDANGDAMLALDAAGTLYASDLGAGLPLFASTDHGSTWAYKGNPVPGSESSDRQWSWGGKAGTVVQAWMALGDSTRSIGVATSHDGGAKFSKPFEADSPVGWVGPISGNADGSLIVIPYTKPTSATTTNDPTGDLLLVDPTVELRYIVSTNGGDTWTTATTGITITKDPAAAQWSGTLMAPILSVLGDGRLAYVWSEQSLSADRTKGAPEAVVKVSYSQDQKSWSAPVVVSGKRTGIMPWVVPLGGARFAVTYYAADDVHADHDYEGTWDVDVTVVDGDATATSHVATAVHQGGICARGGICFLTAADRSLLDFLGGTLLPDGRVAIAYVSSPGGAASGATSLATGNPATVHVAVQKVG